MRLKRIKTRFRDYTTCRSQFEQLVLVQCPHCGDCARSRYMQDQQIWQVACTHCGYAKSNTGKIKQYGAAIDPVFGLPLWLQSPCCCKILWAYNGAHLDFLESYVQATLRERQGKRGNHHSIAVRLPRWMKLAKNREAILKAIEFLKTRLQEAGSSMFL